MMDEQMEEMASLYVLGELKADQSARFEAELLGSVELQKLVSDLQEDFASLALAAPMVRPPAGIKPRLIQQFRAENAPAKIVRVSFLASALPWAIAAALAVAATLLLVRQDKLQKQIVELENRDAFSQLRVAVLQAQADAFAGGSAVVVWNEKDQKGSISVSKLPVHAGKDYQLWMLDPLRKEPINAGLIPVVNDGKKSVPFHPDLPVGRGSKFAISVEQKGGVSIPAGEVVFVGE